MTARRLLVVGGDGLIGVFLVAAFAQRGWTVLATTRRPSSGGRMVPLDLSDPGAADAALPSVDVAIFSAAMARFADCRAAPDLARRVNVEAPVALAQRLARQGTRAILLSTGAVFDGTRPRPAADTPVSPASLYGSLKVEAERGFAANGGGVVRLTKVLDRDHALFCGWRSALRRGEPVEAFDDLRLAPIALDDVLAGVLASIDGMPITQVSAATDISYADAARHLAKGLGLDPMLVRRASAAERGIPKSDRPCHATLDAGVLTGRNGWRPPDPLALIDRLFVAGEVSAPS